MRRPTFISLLPLLLAADGPQLYVPTNPQAILQWDAPTTNSDGTPCTDISGYIVAISGPTVDLSSGGTALQQIQCAVAEQAIAPLVSTRPAGVYRLWARAIDSAGNLSAWSEPLLVILDSTVPGRPTGLRLKITVIVEVR